MKPRISICAAFLGPITASAVYRDGGARPCEARRTAARARCLVALAPLLAGRDGGSLTLGISYEF